MGDITRLQNSQPVQITDDSSQVVVISTGPAGTEAGLVVRNIPFGTQTVAGTVTNVPSGTQNAQGTWTAGQVATGASILAIQGVTGGVAVPISGTITNVPSGTQTIAGTVTNVPSGTQTVAGTVTLSSQTVTIASGTVTTVPSGTQTVAGSVTLSSATTAVAILVRAQAALNSTTSILGPSETYTGTASACYFYASIQVMIYTDADSAVNGLTVAQSADGVTWDITDSFTVGANQEFSTNVAVVGNYFRVVYVNGYNQQSYFHLTCGLSSAPPTPRTLTAGGNLQVSVAELFGKGSTNIMGNYSPTGAVMSVNDDDLHVILRNILKELKKIRFGMELVLDKELPRIDDGDGMGLA